jgi:UDP-N-acetylmuramoyl-L-alanyl-D-glutamate--2,6-diaminopimelate ligase
MEVSSHALAQARVDAIHFDVVVFTNLSHDHLDFHGSMEEYFDVKASLFTPARAVRGIVNADSPWGRRLLERPQIPLVAVEAAQASEVELRIGSSAFTWRTERVRVPLSGAINVGNALLAAEAAYALGIDAGTIAAGLARSEPVPGRMEVVATGGGEGPPFAVLVDYAHTPDGLAAVLREARHLAAPGARVVVVLGCGGDRDKAKRPEMGALAAQLADLGILTSDNARSEDPAMILDEMVAGVPPEAISSGRVVIDEDRERAIGTALDLAAPGDVVLVAGKGHETTQVHGQRAVPFDDREVAREHLRRRFAGDPAAWVRGRGA